MIQYCDRGISVERQYYHVKKRSEETPLEYLFRDNVAGAQAEIPVKDGIPAIRKEHVEHFITTLDDEKFADQLVLLRMGDADELENTLRAYQRGRARQGQVMMGSNKFRQKAPAASIPVPSKPARAVRAIRMEKGSSDSEYD